MEENIKKLSNGDESTARSDSSSTICKNCFRLSLRNSEVKNRILKLLEITFVIVMILLAWGLFLLPIILHRWDYIITNEDEKEATSLEAIHDDSVCSNTKQLNQSYHKCHLELKNILLEFNCSLKSDQIISVVNDGKELADQVFSGLEFINAKESCLEEATSFICLYAYGLCSSSGIYIQPTSSQCEELRDSLCQREWATAVRFGIALPDCNELPADSAKCSEVNISSPINMSRSLHTGEQSSSSQDVFECSEGFFKRKGSRQCIPNCYSWHQFDIDLSILFDVLFIIAVIVGTISCFFILGITYIRRKKMCTFPLVLVVYVVIDVLILYVFVFINYTDRAGLYCSSKNLIRSLLEVTPFCVITGMFLMYIMLQIVVWSFFHTSILFWKVFFPFHSRTFAAAGKLKYLHIACLLVGFLLPLETVISAMSYFGVRSQNRARKDRSAIDLFISGGLGYNNARYPPILCSFSNADVLFYSFILPVDTMITIESTLLILLLWQIRRTTSKKKRNLSGVFKFGTAEKKLLVVYIYLQVFIFLSLINFTIHSSPRFLRDRALSYYQCERKGRNPENPCELPKSDLNQYYSLSLVSYVVIGLFPTVVLVYAINIIDLKKMVKKKLKWSKQSSSRT